MDYPYPICENCIFVDEPIDKDPCQECNRAFLAQHIKPNFVSKRKPKTNADRIRAMTDEELAEFFQNTTFCDSCFINKNECGTESYSCIQRWLDWLKQEAEGGTQ
jgi:hypothetical protein